MPAARRALPVVLAFAAMASADPPASQPAPPAADLWQRLASPDFAVREAATDELWRQGEAARPALVAALDHATPDVQERCRRVLWLLDLGLTPQTPQPALDAIANYDYDATPQEKYRRLSVISQTPGAATAALLRLGVDEPDVNVRRRIYGIAGADAVGAFARRLIDAGDDAMLRRLAEAFVNVDADGGTLTLAMTLADEDGRLAADTAALEAPPADGPPRNGPPRVGLAAAAARQPLVNRRLARQYFALGRTQDAIVAADASVVVLRVGGSLKYRIAAGDFDGVLKLADPGRAPLLRVAAMAATGDEAGARAAAADMAAANAEANAAVRRQTARLCLLVGAVPQGVDLLAKLGEVRVLAVQGRWAEALDSDAVADNGGEIDPARAPRLRAPAEKEALRREAGLVPYGPAVRVAETDPAAAALATAAGLWKTGQAEKTLDALAAALPPVRPGEPTPQPDRTDMPQLRLQPLRSREARPETAVSLRAAALLLRAACYDTQHRPAEATADRRLARRYAASSDAVWVGVVERLDAVGLDALADAEAERLNRFRPDGDWAAATVCERQARAATRRGDHKTAAAARDKQLLWHAAGLTTAYGGVGYTEAVGYLRGPYLRELAHARLDLAAGDRPAAVERLKHAMLYQPIDGSLAIEFVPKLDAAGDKAADAIFDAVWDRQRALIAAYPQAAQLRNTAAWTMLRTGRHAADALKLAAEAVALRPGEPAYLDTYAEALFVAGQKAAAIDAMRRVVKLLPDDKLTRDRLAGFEQGKVVVPDEPE